MVALHSTMIVALYSTNYDSSIIIVLTTIVALYNTMIVALYCTNCSIMKQAFRVFQSTVQHVSTTQWTL